MAPSGCTDVISPNNETSIQSSEKQVNTEAADVTKTQKPNKLMNTTYIFSRYSLKRYYSNIFFLFIFDLNSHPRVDDSFLKLISDH